MGINQLLGLQHVDVAEITHHAILENRPAPRQRSAVAAFRFCGLRSAVSGSWLAKP
jgi:hypothetical protein